ncbi:hypothetical protein F9L33_13105 [Amylibacter sp. SFDW26]|nr:hypothetical protein F9L33_13105 [Amylibacter sp. SFDW26]
MAKAGYGFRQGQVSSAVNLSARLAETVGGTFTPENIKKLVNNGTLILKEGTWSIDQNKVPGRVNKLPKTRVQLQPKPVVNNGPQKATGNPATFGEKIMKAIGVSNFGPQNFSDAMKKAGIRYASAKNDISANDSGYILAAIMGGSLNAGGLTQLQSSGILKIKNNSWSLDRSKLSVTASRQATVGIYLNKNLTVNQKNRLVAGLKRNDTDNASRHDSYNHYHFNPEKPGEVVNIPKKKLGRNLVAFRTKYTDGTEIETISKYNGRRGGWINQKTTIMAPTQKKGVFDKITFSFNENTNQVLNLAVDSKSGKKYELTRVGRMPVIEAANGFLRGSTQFGVDAAETYLINGQAIDAPANTMFSSTIETPRKTAGEIQLEKLAAPRPGQATYEVRFSSGETTRITIIETGNERRNKKKVKEVAVPMALFPPRLRSEVLKTSISYVPLPPGHFAQATKLPTGQKFIRISTSMSSDGYEAFLQNALVHEIAHFYQSEIDPHAWLDAMNADGRSVSGYAKFSSAEDYAETYTIWYNVRSGNYDKKVSKSFEDRFKNRFNVLDRTKKVHVLLENPLPENGAKEELR